MLFSLLVTILCVTYNHKFLWMVIDGAKGGHTCHTGHVHDYDPATPFRMSMNKMTPNMQLILLYFLRCLLNLLWFHNKNMNYLTQVSILGLCIGACIDLLIENSFTYENRLDAWQRIYIIYYTNMTSLCGVQQE